MVRKHDKGEGGGGSGGSALVAAIKRNKGKASIALVIFLVALFMVLAVDT